MTEKEAEIKLYNMLEDTAMVPVGYVDNLIGQIYKDFRNEKTNLKKILNLNLKYKNKKRK
jgi:hypothetical protein